MTLSDDPLFRYLHHEGHFQVWINLERGFGPTVSSSHIKIERIRKGWSTSTSPCRAK